MTALPAISLWQPWASLVFSGRKSHETRSFAVPPRHVGRTVAIHATARFPHPRMIGEDLHRLCVDEFGSDYRTTLPLGSVLGTVTLSASLPTELRSWTDEDDRISGDWSPGRFAWPMTDIAPYTAPVEAKGRQGWWSFQVGDASR